MCEPTMMASLAFSALSAGVQYMGQKETAEATAKYNQKMVNKNAENANKAYKLNAQQENTRMIQEEAVMSNDLQNIDAEKRKAVGKALASSSGASYDTQYLLGEYERQEGRQVNAVRQQWDWKQAQSVNNLKGYEAQANNRIASVNPAPVSGPSLVGALAGFGADATGIYSNYKKTLKDT